MLVPGGTATLRGIQSQFGLLKGAHFLRFFFVSEKDACFFPTRVGNTLNKKKQGGDEKCEEVCEAKRFEEMLSSSL